jgi:hypothetical protein
MTTKAITATEYPSYCSTLTEPGILHIAHHPPEKSQNTSTKVASARPAIEKSMTPSYKRRLFIFNRIDFIPILEDLEPSYLLYF